MPISTIPVKWLNSQSNQYTSRFEVPTERDGLVGRGIANPELKSNKDVSDKKDKGAGSGNIVSTAPFSAVPSRHFEPTCPFGHGISNPTPYQARRPPHFFGVMRDNNIFADPISERTRGFRYYFKPTRSFVD